jgi:DNA primase
LFYYFFFQLKVFFSVEIKKAQNPPHMTIQQIKSKLSILTVLSHYGLEMDRNGMLCCPFHEDGKASMKVYEETNTVYCFAGSCKVSNLDTIDFIMQMDGSTKHEAIKKAISQNASPKPATMAVISLVPYPIFI